jgi:Ser/Thr protein kinase RdoA (MazF antagonist)
MIEYRVRQQVGKGYHECTFLALQTLGALPHLLRGRGCQRIGNIRATWV